MTNLKNTDKNDASVAEAAKPKTTSKRKAAGSTTRTKSAAAKGGTTKKAASTKSSAAKKTTAKKTTTKTAAKRTTKKSAPEVAVEKPVAVQAIQAEKEMAIHDVETMAATPEKKKNPERIFALDIGTRSVIGIVAEYDGETLRILDTERQEHTTRAMLDGQIHDVPQVAAVIRQVKSALSERVGPLRSAAVAAAGRALYTMTATAEADTYGLISEKREKNLEFAAVQNAQKQLAISNTVEDATDYYCVGYSTIKFELDGVQLKTLVGQRGKKASATVIATFLPRQVIDSMQSALQASGLDMKALTLEPIAAINVLIPPTMRHLNLTLVDIGAGTSDVAITRNGSVIAYGMVPLAGDEITEAISLKFLLDFNVAEQIKRNAANGENSKFSDILGLEYELTPDEVLDPIMPTIQNLAGAISRHIMELNNNEAPQAVLLAGGGAMTPRLQKLVADILKMPLNRVAVSRPNNIDGIVDLPDSLKSSDSVTPLGILKIASSNTLHFMRVYIDDQEYSLFNFREMTVSDALLSAGKDLRSLNGKPGEGISVTIDGEKTFFPGSMGTMAKIFMNGQEVDLETSVEDECYITVEKGENGRSPEITIRDLETKAPTYPVFLNGAEIEVASQWQLNGKDCEMDTILSDGDELTIKEDNTMLDFLKSADLAPTGKKVQYSLNGSSSYYTIRPHILLNDIPANLSDEVHPGDQIDYIAQDAPKLSQVLNVSEMDSYIKIYYNNKEYKIKSSGVSIEVNGRPANFNTLIQDGSEIRYATDMGAAVTVSEALLAVGFVPPPASSHMRFTLKVNNQEVSFTDPIKHLDFLEIELEKMEERKPIIPVTRESIRKELEINHEDDNLMSIDSNNVAAAPDEEEKIPAEAKRSSTEPMKETATSVTSNAPAESPAPKPTSSMSMLERLGYSADDVSKAAEAAPKPQTAAYIPISSLNKF